MNIEKEVINNFKKYPYYVIRNFLITKTFGFPELMDEIKKIKSNPIELYLFVDKLASELSLNPTFILDFIDNRNCKLININHHPSVKTVVHPVSEYNSKRRIRKIINDKARSNLIYLEGQNQFWRKEKRIQGLSKGNWVQEGFYLKIEPEYSPKELNQLLKLLQDSYKVGFDQSNIKSREDKGQSSKPLEWYLYFQKLLRKEYKSYETMTNPPAVKDSIEIVTNNSCAHFYPKLTGQKFKLRLGYFKQSNVRLADRFNLPEFSKLNEYKQLIGTKVVN